MLLCENGNYYTGYTDDLNKRYQAHVDGSSRCKYTRSFKPVHIAQSWKIPGDKVLALKIERHIKSLTRVDKERIILEPHIIDNVFCLGNGITQKSGLSQGS